MIKKRNSSVSLALECALLILAIFVFNWGLHAKLALYHTDQGTSSANNSSAKLSAETRIASAAILEDNQDPSRSTLDSLHFAGITFSLQGHPTIAQIVHIEAGPRIAGQYYLHGPDLKHRPPPRHLLITS